MARTFQNEQALASAPIGPLMFRLAAPAVAAQLINVLYNIVDRIYTSTFCFCTSPWWEKRPSPAWG